MRPESSAAREHPIDPFEKTTMVTPEKMQDIVNDPSAKKRALSLSQEGGAEYKSALVPLAHREHIANNQEKRQAGIEPAYALTAPDGSFTFVASHRGDMRTIQELAEAGLATMKKEEWEKPLGTIPSLELDSATGGEDMKHLRSNTVDKIMLGASLDLVTRFQAHENAVQAARKGTGKEPASTAKMPAFLFGKIYAEETLSPPDTLGGQDLSRFLENGRPAIERQLEASTLDPYHLGKKVEWKTDLDTLPGELNTTRMHNFFQAERLAIQTELTDLEKQIQQLNTKIEKGRPAEDEWKSPNKKTEKFKELVTLQEETQKKIEAAQEIQTAVQRAEIGLDSLLKSAERIQTAEAHIREQQLKMDPGVFEGYVDELIDAPEIEKLNLDERRILVNALSLHRTPTEERMGGRTLDTLSAQDQELVQAALEEVTKYAQRLKDAKKKEFDSISDNCVFISEALPGPARAALFQETRRLQLGLPPGLERSMARMPAAIPEDGPVAQALKEKVFSAADADVAHDILRELNSHPELAKKIIGQKRFRELSPTTKRALAARLQERALISPEELSSLTKRQVLKLHGSPKDQISVFVIHADGTAETLVRPTKVKEKELPPTDFSLAPGDRILALHAGFEDTNTPMPEPPDEAAQHLAQEAVRFTNLDLADASDFLKRGSDRTHMIIQPLVESEESRPEKKKKATRPSNQTVVTHAQEA